jgi:uncharacterized protein (TIGR00369 family)
VPENGGLEQLRGWFNAMPIMRTLSARVEELAADGATVVVAPPAAELNPNGAVSGGILAAVADVTGGFVVSAGGDEGEYQSTSDLTLHFMRAALALPLTARSRVLRRGRRNCVVQIEISDAEGKLCTVATGTWVLFPGSRHARSVGAG